MIDLADIENDEMTLDSLIDGEPDDDGIGSCLNPIKERLEQIRGVLAQSRHACAVALEFIEGLQPPGIEAYLGKPSAGGTNVNATLRDAIAQISEPQK